MTVPIQFMLFVLLATLLGYATSTSTSAAATTSSHLRHHKPNQQHQHHHQQQQRSLQQWCGQCFWRGTIVCDARVQYLIDKYTQTQTTARESLIADQTCTSPTGEAERTMSLEAFCGDCQWSQMTFNCDTRVVFLMENYQLSEDKAVEGLLEKGECVDPDYVEGEDNDGDGSVVNNKDVVFCGDCPYPGDCCMTCDEKAESLTEKMTVKEAQLEILGECNKLPGEGDTVKNDTNIQNESNSNTGMIAWIVVAILLLILLILLVIFMRRRNGAKEEGIEEDNNNNKEEEEKQMKKKEEEEEKRKSDIEKDSNIPLVDMVPMAIATSMAIESDPENNPPSPATLDATVDETTTPGPPPLILPEKTRRSSSRRREQAEVNKAIEDDTSGGDKSDEDAVEIWVPKDVDIEDQSQLTFDDDWSRDPVKVRPDPVGDTNFVNPLPSTMEEEEVGASSSGVSSGQQQKLATIKLIRTEDVGDESSPRKGVSVDEFTGLSEGQGNENLGLEKVATVDSERAQAPQGVASSSNHAPPEDAIAQRRGSQDP